MVRLFSLAASAQIKLRRIDGWRKIAAVLSQHTSVAAFSVCARRETDVTVDDALDLIFKRLCEAFRLKPDGELTGVTLRGEIPEAVFVEALRAVRGRSNDQDLKISFAGGDPDRIVLGTAWRARCEDRSPR